METRADPFMAHIECAIQAFPFVQQIVHRVEDGIDVLVVQGTNLSLDDIDRIIDAKWEAIDAYPGRYVDINLQYELE